MKRLGLVLDSCFQKHDTGPAHPERPERIESIERTLTAEGLLEDCRRLAPERAGDELLALAHDLQHIRRVEQACAGGQRLIDSMDTAIGPASAEVARLAAGSVAALCREVARGQLLRGFAVVRPPGHHAERDLAMGFCLFNNVAVAARYLRTQLGLERVLVCDWDVHHGNGTQHIFEEDPTVFYFSLHQWPLYPGTGSREEVGKGAGRGTTLNCPLPPGSGDDAFLGALADELAPAAARFRPDFVLISAGFDAHQADPLANMLVSTAAYARATDVLCDLADRWAQGRLVSVLEGGYDLQALSASTALHLRTLLQRSG